MLALRHVVTYVGLLAAAACAAPPAQPEVASAPHEKAAAPPTPPVSDADLPGDAAAPSAPASVLDECTEQPFGHVEQSTGQAFRGAWFECDRARLYAARIEGPKSFVQMMVGSALENQKRLARDRNGSEVVEERGVKIPLGGQEVPAWRVVLSSPNKQHQAIMVLSSFTRDGRGYALLCLAPDDNAEVACHHPYDDLMAYAAAIADP